MKTTNSVELSVSYRDGSILVEGEDLLVDTIDKGLRENIRKRVIDLRLLVPETIGEEVLAALRTGDISLDISQAKTLFERMR